jgi:hypothetical protein
MGATMADTDFSARIIGMLEELEAGPQDELARRRTFDPDTLARSTALRWLTDVAEPDLHGSIGRLALRRPDVHAVLAYTLNVPGLGITLADHREPQFATIRTTWTITVETGGALRMESSLSGRKDRLAENIESAGTDVLRDMVSSALEEFDDVVRSDRKSTTDQPGIRASRRTGPRVDRQTPRQ